ncbi:MAG: BrnT family toxin [Cyanobacteriota bacterium]
MNINFEWDENKNQINIDKHGLSFEVAIECWEDPLSFEYEDEEHSSPPNEIRYYKFGKLRNGTVIRLVYVEILNDVFRIITAYTSKKIEELYYEGNK